MFLDYEPFLPSFPFLKTTENPLLEKLIKTTFTYFLCRGNTNDVPNVNMGGTIYISAFDPGRASSYRYCKDEILSKYCRDNIQAAYGVQTYRIPANPQTTARFLSVLPTIFPKWLPKEALSQEDLELLKLLSTGNLSDFFTKIEDWAEALDFGDRAYRAAFQTFVSDHVQEEISQNIKMVEDLYSQIDELQTSISEKLKTISDLNDRTTLLKERDDSDETIQELVAFAKKLPGVNFFKGEQSSLIMVVETPLTQVDPGLLSRILQTDRHVFFKYTSYDEDSIRLYSKIWETGEVELMTISSFQIDHTNMVKAWDNYPSPEFLRSMNHVCPHPHIYRYGCVGDYVEVFNDIARNGDTFAAISAAISSAKSLNLTDSTVCEYLAHSLFVGGYKCLRYRNEWYTVHDLKEKLKEENCEADQIVSERN